MFCFCIENIALQLEKTGTEIFNLLYTSGLLQNYIFPAYEALHTSTIDQRLAFHYYTCKILKKLLIFASLMGASTTTSELHLISSYQVHV
ncbi:MAG: DUF3791 domain-containing protein [Treponema sp.]|nr:DUF3791 domain-containing protein [Treponema sp.]